VAFPVLVAAYPELGVADQVMATTRRVQRQVLLHHQAIRERIFSVRKKIVLEIYSTGKVMAAFRTLLLLLITMLPALSIAEDKGSPEENFFSSSDNSPFKVSPVVSVIISGTSDAHVSEVLSTAIGLSRKVPVRNVAIIANGNDMQRFSAQDASTSGATDAGITQEQRAMLDKLGAQLPKSPFAGLFKELKLVTSEMKGGDQLKERLRISYSPTWVVRFEGRDYIYEGYPNISRMFDAKGGFQPE